METALKEGSSKPVKQPKSLAGKYLTLDEIKAHLKEVETLVYTDANKAHELLAKVKVSLDYHHEEGEDIILSYYMNRALLENQVYNYTLSSDYFQKALSLLEEHGNPSALAETYLDYVATLINMHEETEAREVLAEVTKLLNAFPDKRLESRLLCREAYVHLYFGSNPTKALESLVKAQEKIDKVPKEQLGLKDFYFISLIKSGMGDIYKRTQEYSKSAKAYSEVLELCKAFGMKSRMAWHLLNVGNAYMAMGEFEHAATHFTDAIQATYDVAQQARAMAYANLGYCFLQREKFPEALELFRRAETLFRDDREKNLANIELWRAQIYLAVDRRKKGLKHLIAARNLARKAGEKKQLAMVLKYLAKWYADEYEFEKAYEFQKEYEDVIEAYFAEEKASELQELEIKYEAEKKEKEAEMFRLQAISLQLKALRAQMNPHFLFNCLNSVQSYITSKDPEKASVYLSKFATLVRKSLDFSELEIISVEKEREFLQDYLEINEKLRFENRMSYEIVVDEEIDEDICGIPTMIIQPYVENAIEHGIRSREDGFIKIHFSLEDEDTILCVVEDNGLGREKAREQQQRTGYKKHISFGTKITRERLKVLFKTRNEAEEQPVRIIDLKNQEGTPCGTRVEIRLPILDLPIRKSHKEF